MRMHNQTWCIPQFMPNAEHLQVISQKNYLLNALCFSCKLKPLEMTVKWHEDTYEGAEWQLNVT